MKSPSRIIIFYLLVAFARSEEQLENDDAKLAAACNTVECYKLLKPRLEAMEMVVRKIVSAILSQTGEVFAPIKEILEEDPTIISILSSNSSAYSSSTNSKDASLVNNGAFKESGQKYAKNTAVDNLKGAVKCSLAHFVDINSIGPNLRSDPSIDFTAQFYKDTIKLKWLIPSAECLRFSSGVWIRIYESIDGDIMPVESSLYVPQKCLKKISRTWHAIDVVLPFSSSTTKNNSCAFSLAMHLIQCHSYIVKVIRNYQSFAGKVMQTELVIPPELDGQANMGPLIISASARSNSLTLNWEDNSGCAPQLTSLNLKIVQDGNSDYSDKANATITIPRSCFKQPTGEENLFSLALPTSMLACPIEWKPLDVCRKYRIEMNSQYTATWNGLPSSLEIFTEQGAFLRCPMQQYYCATYKECHHISDVCDSTCGNVEEYCEQEVCFKGGFRCGQQCIHKAWVCDGEYDCMDGSDEGPDCNYVACYQLSNLSGNFSSQKFSIPSTEIHPEKIAMTVRKTLVLISVQPAYRIWLTFNKFNTFPNQHAVKVYDGPYSTSPLLLSHNGSTKPYSVRSSSNDLFVEFPSYLSTIYGIEAFYTSVRDTNDRFLPGCGGYIYDSGFIPNSFSKTSMAGCFWYVEARESEDTLLLKMNISDADTFQKAQSRRTLIVYDGWSADGRVLYDGKEPGLQNNTVIYSESHKVLVYLKLSPWVTLAKKDLGFSWSIATQKSTPYCSSYFVENTGTIKSPNYPVLYPNSIDCRWSIKVDPGSKVRLLFAFFETEDGADFLFVYDGPTLRSSLLLAQSGSVPTPVIVNSSTNQVYVRFTSDDDTSFPGFLAVYLSV